MFEHLSGKKFSFITLGCKVNSYESDAIRQQLIGCGCIPADEDEPADIVIVNTCSVTNIADRKSRQMLHRARQNSTDAVIAATGCYAQLGGMKLLRDGDADIVVGNDHKSELPRLLDSFLAGERDSTQNCLVSDISHQRCYEPMEISECSERTRAFIKIEDGCDQFCSYCAIPYARGRVRSRSAEDVVCEVKRLAAAGFKEVVLTGIHLSSYGITHYEKQDGISFDFRPLLSLIRETAAVDGIERIRLGSLEPRIICRDFTDALAAIPEFCPHFHLSLQSGCAATLKRMNRHYSPEEFLDKCAIIRESFERPGITTDVIVGFPGETEEEFEGSAAFLEQVSFSRMHIFKFSRRGGTAADRMAGQLSESVKHERSEKLLALDSRLRRQFMEKFEGCETKVLFESYQTIDGMTYLTGLTGSYTGVAVRSDKDSCSPDSFGQMRTVRITGILDDEHMIGVFTDGE